MNGRLYDPLLHRFLAPDNYVQDPYNTQNFNRYGYVYNNPLMYTDITGEWFGIDDAITFVIGGTVNLVVNAIQGNIDSWADGFAAFGAGGAAGTLALYGPAGWIAGGAILGGTNAYLAGGNVGMGVLTGAVSGLAGGAAGQWASRYLGGFVLNGIHVSGNSAIGGFITGAIGGAAGGYAGNFTSGLIMTGDISEAHRMGVSGLAFGATIGGSIGAAYGYHSAKQSGLDPLTGKPKNSIAIGRSMESWVDPHANKLNSETISDAWDLAVKKNAFSPLDRIGGRGFNKEWITGKINEGYHIFDLGTPSKTFSPLKPSLNYSLEHGVIKSLNYQRHYNVSIRSYKNFNIYTYK